MPVDTIVDLRQLAGNLAHRLGSLSHFIPAAQELLDVIHRLSSEILLRHNRKIVTLVEISRATLTRAGLNFTSCIPALRNYKTLYFDILRALQERQEVIIDSDSLRVRVSRLLMPLSTWLVIQQGNPSSATPFSAPAFPERYDDATPLPPQEISQFARKSVPARAIPHSATAPEELMPPPASLPHRFQQPPSTTPRGRPLLQADHNKSSGTIRIARTRSPRRLPCVEPETLAGQPPPEEALPPVLAQRRTQRFGIFCTAATGSVVRRRGLRSSP